MGRKINKECKKEYLGDIPYQGGVIIGIYFQTAISFSVNTFKLSSLPLSDRKVQFVQFPGLCFKL